MGIVKKISMVGLAAVTAMAISMPSAEARSGRKAALIGGLLVGAIAGAAIAGAAQANDDDYQPAPRYYAPQPAYGYDQDPYYQPQPSYYQPAPVYRVQPSYYGYGYGCGPEPQLDPNASGRERDLYWHQRHKWKKACRAYGGY